MTQPTSPSIHDPDSAATDCIFDTILGFLLPFFLTAARANPNVARATILELIEAYRASSATELDLVGRIIGFSIAAMDNLRLSMTSGMSDRVVLRYRSNAVTLSRASDQARKILEAVQSGQDQPFKTPRPSIAAAPPAPPHAPSAVPVDTGEATYPVMPPFVVPTAMPGTGEATEFAPQDLETMKRDARIMMGAFSRHGAQRVPSPPPLDPAQSMNGGFLRPASPA